MKKRFLALLVFLLSPFMFVSANSEVSDLHFENGYMVFQTEDCSKVDLSYVSEDGKIKFEIKEDSFRQSHRIQLWNLDFTSFKYVLKTTDAFNNKSIKEGAFTVSSGN